MLKIVGIQLFDINWGKDITLPNKGTIMLKNDSEIETYLCNGGKTISDEAVDRYLLKKYGITAEDFGVEFITNMSFASNVD